MCIVLCCIVSIQRNKGREARQRERIESGRLCQWAHHGSTLCDSDRVRGGWEAQRCPPAYTTSCLIAHWHLHTHTHTRSLSHTDTLTHTSGQRCEEISPAAFLMSVSSWLSHHCWLCPHVLSSVWIENLLHARIYVSCFHYSLMILPNELPEKCKKIYIYIFKLVYKTGIKLFIM